MGDHRKIGKAASAVLFRRKSCVVYTYLME
jgi:hypothetical protein